MNRPNLKYDDAIHAYYLDGVRIPSVTQVLKGAGLIDFSHVPQERLEAAMKFGTAVHLATELYDQDNLDDKDLDPALRPYLDAWIKCKKDTGMVIEGIEEIVCSVKYRFAGKLDRRIVLDKRGVLDIKTSLDISPATRVQLAGYEMAHNEGKPMAEKSHRRWACLLKEDGTYNLEEYKDRSDASIFLAALTVSNFKGGKSWQQN